MQQGGSPNKARVPAAGTGAALGVCCEGVECVGEMGNAAFVKGCETCVHRHGFPFRLSVGCMLEPDQA